MPCNVVKPSAGASRSLMPARLEVLEPRQMFDGASGSLDVLSYHGDDGSTGQYLQETTLTPTNVNASQFGKLSSTPVDGQVYAQPLYMSRLEVTAGDDPGVHDVMFVATQHDSLYAIDANSGRDPLARQLPRPRRRSHDPLERRHQDHQHLARGGHHQHPGH